ncbi:hypothetical protein EDD21DRAFT_443107 [Dissophora ornata]|nr:hypothetical protein BGZ58_008311 [Dissophora ornata]KAI8602151.1 hypothetical protein EDD21DRAFT_443107 [Dissophora ornata]
MTSGPHGCHALDQTLHVSARLAPEIILHILSFLDSCNEPSALWPILTLCKQWARLALELIYHQPIVNINCLHSFVATLALQDRLHNGQTPFWDSACHDATHSYPTNLSMGLGIDYRAMIKKPCRIVGTAAPVKQDLIQLWDLQALLWTAPAFARADSPPPTTVEVSPPPSPTPSRSKSPKAVLVRRKKRSLPPPGPVVLLLDISEVFSHTMQYILHEVPGMRLSRLHYKWLLNVPLLDLLEANLLSLRKLIFSRPPTRQDEFLAIAQLLANARHLDTLILDHCQAAGTTVLTQFARSCGASLRTLEIRQHIIIRPVGEHTLFPVDGPEDWNQDGINSESIQESTGTQASIGSSAEPSSYGQSCIRCSIALSDNPTHLIDNIVWSLAVSDVGVTSLNGAGAPTPLQDNNVLAEMDMESRIDLALKEFGYNCAQMSRIRLQHLTWISDESLAGFKPTVSALFPRHQDRRQGLKEIELLDSYYGSQVTVEGVLELCGPNLEVFNVDRKSCWRTRISAEERGEGLCSSCANQERERRAKFINMSTGDRLLSGLIQKGESMDGVSHQPERIRQLDTLILIEHWVSVVLLKRAMALWRSTLRVLTLRLFKCSIEDLTEALAAHSDSEPVVAAALEKLTLGLPWMDANDCEVVGLVQGLFVSNKSLYCIHINSRVWNREDIDTL